MMLTPAKEVGRTPPAPETNMMSETPEEWLERLFEFEYCAECGGDAVDHEVFLVPGIGTYFARCRRQHGVGDDDAAATRPDTAEVGREQHPSEDGHDRLDRRMLLLRLS